MRMKRRTSNREFGKGLSQLRRAKGITQIELAKKIGTSQRMIAYYEGETNFPPAHLLIPIAKALKISVDVLLGLKNIKLTDTNHIRFWNQIKKAETLSLGDKKALIKVLEGLLAKSNSLKTV